jgi:hypothetical protein
MTSTARSSCTGRSTTSSRPEKKARYPDDPRVRSPSDETRAIVSEPLVDLPGAWQEVPESHAGIVRPGDHEIRPCAPRRAAVPAI